MWLCCLYAHSDIKFINVDSILMDIFEKIYRPKSTPTFDMSTHTNAIFNYNELRPTTILFQLPRHPPWRKNRLQLVLRWGGVTPISRALLRFCRYTTPHSCAFNLNIFLSQEITVWVCLVIKILSGVNLISSYLACQLLQIIQLHLKTQLAINRNDAQDN